MQLFFKKWLFEGFGSFHYEVPEDKEQQLYDFYMLHLLRGRNVQGQRLISTGNSPMASRDQPYFEPGKSQFSDLNDKETQIDYMIEEITNKLLPTLKDELLDATFFALCAEFRHLFDENKPEDVVEIFPDYKEFIRKYMKYTLLLDSPHKSLVSREPVGAKKGEKSEYSTAHNAVLKSMEKTGLSKDKIVEYMINVFDNKRNIDFGNDKVPANIAKGIKWNTDYGGKAWANIARGWLRLNKSKSKPDMFINIDHVYDLQHNTDTVFNKLKTYYKEGYDWIKKALDHKAEIRNPGEIINKVSPWMRKLAIPAMKMKYGITLQSLTEKSDEVKKLYKIFIELYNSIDYTHRIYLTFLHVDELTEDLFNKFCKEANISKYDKPLFSRFYSNVKGMKEVEKAIENDQMPIVGNFENTKDFWNVMKSLFSNTDAENISALNYLKIKTNFSEKAVLKLLQHPEQFNKGISTKTTKNDTEELIKKEKIIQKIQQVEGIDSNHKVARALVNVPKKDINKIIQYLMWKKIIDYVPSDIFYKIHDNELIKIAEFSRDGHYLINQEYYPWMSPATSEKITNMLKSDIHDAIEFAMEKTGWPLIAAKNLVNNIKKNHGIKSLRKTTDINDIVLIDVRGIQNAYNLVDYKNIYHRIARAILYVEQKKLDFNDIKGIISEMIRNKFDYGGTVLSDLYKTTHMVFHEYTDEYALMIYYFNLVVNPSGLVSNIKEPYINNLNEIINKLKTTSDDYDGMLIDANIIKEIGTRIGWSHTPVRNLCKYLIKKYKIRKGEKWL